jgi:hypothetical protein
MSHIIREIGVSHQIGKYSDAVEVRPNLHWLFTSGTPGLEIDSTLPNDLRARPKWPRFLGGSEPASMLLVIPQLVRPEFLVEVEIVAAAEAQ